MIDEYDQRTEWEDLDFSGKPLEVEKHQRHSEKMPTNHAERQKRYRQKHGNKYREKERERMRTKRRLTKLQPPHMV